MPDMLVKLYDLPDRRPVMEKLEARGILLRRAIVPEKYAVTKWVMEKFGKEWAGECETAFSRIPVSCHIAVLNGELLGFACYDATCRGFFGPTGVAEKCRGMGVGKGLLLASLYSMAEVGYAYAIIGGAGPVEYYKHVVGAIEIDGSHPGIYKNMVL